MKPEDAALARRIVEGCSTATLATLTRDDPSAPYPFGSLVAVATDAHGRPLLLLSKLAEHTKNLEACPRASLLFADPSSNDPLASPRVTLLGRVRRVPDEEVASAREAYLARHPGAAKWAAFSDFSFYRLDVETIRFVVGFGKMGWVDPVEYGRA